MRRLLLAACVLSVLRTIAFAAPQPTGGTEHDARLDQKVTISALGKPLGEFLTAVSDATGVDMTAGKRLTDHRVCVFVKDFPLSSLQNAIEAVMHVECTRAGTSGEWTYEFGEDVQTRKEIDALKQRDLKALRDIVESHVGLLKISHKQLLEKYGSEDAIPSDLSGKTCGRAILQWYGKLSSQQLDALWKEGKSRFDTSGESTGMTADLLNGTNSTGEMSTRWKAVGSVELSITETDSGSGMEFRYKIAGDLEPTGDEAPSTCTYSGSITADSEIETDDSEQSGAEALDITSGRVQAAKFKLNGTMSPYGFMREIHKQLGTNIVSDYFTSVAEQHSESHDETMDSTLDEILQMPALVMGSKLTTRDGVSLYTNKRWFRSRDRDVPDELVKHWREVIGRQGYLGLTEAMELSALTDSQLYGLDAYGLPDGHPIADSQGLLRFLGMLTPEQFSTAATSKGLLASKLKTSQRKALLSWIATDHDMSLPGEAETANGAKPRIQSIKLHREKWNDGKIEAESWGFSVRTKDGQAMTGLPTPLVNDSMEHPTDADGPMEIKVVGAG